MQIDCRDRTIDDLLRSDYYSIPNFQRPYSWEKQHLEDFWNDIIAAKTADDYFIGSMVMYQETPDKIAIVDGQQRVTTVIIFLCALRDVLIEEGHPQIANTLHDIYIEKLHRDTYKYYTLDPGTSYPYFHNFVMANPTVERPQIERGPEEKAIQDAYEFLKENVTAALDAINRDSTIIPSLKSEARKEKLKEIQDRVFNVKIVFIKLGNSTDAFTVFETLNSRGKDLELSHLVKNHLARYVRNQNPRIDLVTQDWMAIKSLFEEGSRAINIDEFIYHYWSANYKHTTKFKLFRAISAEIHNEVLANAFLKTLLENAHIYRLIHDPFYVGVNLRGCSQEIRHSLDAIKLFAAKMPYPTLISLLNSMQRGVLKPSRAAYCIAKIENYHFITTAITSQRSSGGVSMMYASIARRLAELNDRSGNEIIKELLEKLKRIPEYIEFELHFNELKYTNTYTKDRKLIRYILGKMFSSLGHSPLDISQLSIEHLMPQSQATTDDEKKIVGSIGNLILVSKDINEKLADKPFNEKMLILRAENDINLRDNYLAQATDWGIEQIKERTQRLASIAYHKVWRV